jgi:hypothetical protein
MNEINEIKLPKGVDRISVTQHDDKIVIEFIPKEPKFKIGDKVRVKRGVSIGTNKCDELILTVDAYYEQHRNILYCKGFPYLFHEDWLEPYSEELKKGDLAIFWDYDKDHATIRLYDKKGHEYHYDSNGIYWGNAIKFESKEQFEKLLRGEI